MSDSEPVYQVPAELRRLVSLVCDGELTLEEHQRLEEYLSHDASARAFYYECLALHGELSWNGAARRGGTTQETPAGFTGPRSPAINPILNLLDTGFHQVAGLFSRGIVVTVLLTIGLPGILLLLLVLQVSRQPVAPGPIATVTRMHECVWSDNTATMSRGTGLFAGEQLRLAKGFLEITYVQGARVLLQGPATFKVSGGGNGFLGNGSLVATVGKGAEGFTIQTPAIAVVDLGTEFGVRVEDERGTAEIEVFHGKVELTAADKEDSGKTLRHPLVAGQAARVEVGDRLDQTPMIREIKPTKTLFARRIPSATVKPAETVKPEPAIVADFSGGPGRSGTDQFPGVAGNGWATGWGVGEAKELECITSIEQSSPLLGGGKYLSVMVERKAGGSDDCVGMIIDRRLALKDSVDLTKPHVVLFTVRIDSLSQFTEEGDRFSICTRNVPQSEFSFKKTASSGWHVCVVGKAGNDTRDARSTNWTFLQREKNGRAVAVDSGIIPREGTAYSFRILVDPQARMWTPSIAVDGGEWKEFRTMGMRSAGTAEKNHYWAFLHLYCQLEGGNRGANIEKVGFSVDSIRITRP